MTNSKIVVGLASFGMSGRIFHAPFIEKHTHFNLKYIIERTKSNSKEQYPKSIILRSFTELLAKKEVDLVVINTPSYLHFEMAKSALLAGKNVVLEKPMTAQVSEAQELIKIAKEQDLMLAVYHNKRFEGGFKTVQKLLETKQLGDLIHCKIALHRYRPNIGPKAWKEDNYPGAGLLYDIGSHLIDQSLVLFGWPNDIVSDVQIQREHGKVIDYFNITLHYKNFKVSLISDMLTEESMPTYTLTGTNGSFIKYGNDPQESRLAKDIINWPELGVDIESNYGKLVDTDLNTSQSINTENGSYIDFYQNVYKVLKLKKDLLISPEQALDVIKIIERILKSNNFTI